MSLGEDGYKVFPGVVPQDMCQDVIEDIKKHTEDVPNNDLNTRGGLVEMYHYQSMWNIRQYKTIYDIFSEVLDVRKLWVSIDRICYKPPDHESNTEGFIHWDINPNEWPRPAAVQGLVALEDTDEAMGGFQCLPSLYKGLDKWLKSLPTEKTCYSSFPMLKFGDVCACYYSVNASIDELWTWPVVKVPMKQGDLLIWDSFLPHGNGVNRGGSPRMCQYITMTLEGDERLRCERIDCFNKKKPPSGLAFPGDPRWLERKLPPVELTHLGNKLLGASEWD